MKTSRKSDIAIALILLLLPLLWFAPQVLGGKTLLPADNLFTFEPWAGFAAEQGVGVPHNPLISDLILENYAWKSLIREALSTGQVPLWSPRLFAGAPFLAAGQHSALYPLSLIFYVLPLWLAYGVFTWLQLGLAALGMYILVRVLRQSRPAAFLAAVAYAFSGFFIVSVNFTMIIAAAAWLPWILAAIEKVVRSTDRGIAKSVDGKHEHPAGLPISPSTIPYVVAGALLIGLQVLAGHVEITYYVLLVSALFALWRLLWVAPPSPNSVAPLPPNSGGTIPPKKSGGRGGKILRTGGWLVVMFALGLAIGAVQLVPLYELVSQSFRAGAASLQQVRAWAWPGRQIITFLLPDFFGNPSHHTYFDIWARQWVPVTQNALGEPLNTVDWGVKNYVEGGNYLGIVTLLLAAVATLDIGYWILGIGRSRRKSASTTQYLIPNPQYLLFFALLAILALLFAFGTPLYAVLYYLLPGYNQLHSAFRWVFPYTLSMAVLAGFGLDALAAGYRSQVTGRKSQVTGRTRDLQSVTFNAESRHLGGVGRIARGLGWLAVVAGLAALGAVVLSLVVPGPFVGLGDKLLAWSDLARARGFANGAMAWSYEAIGLARFGAMALLAGAMLWVASRQSNQETRHRIWPFALIALLVADLWLFGHDFNTAADPKLLDFKPPVIQWLQEQQNAAATANTQYPIPNAPWRFTTFNLPGEKTLNANSGMVYGLEDVRGYDSIIPRQYVAYMERIQRQDDLLYNRIAPIYATLDGQANYAALDSPLLDLLGVRYVVTAHTIPNTGYELVYDKEVKVYENKGWFPRAFVVPQAIPAADQAAALDALAGIDPAQTVVVEGLTPETLPPPATPQSSEVRVSRYGLRELFVDVNIGDRGWLVVTNSFFEGWKAYIRPFGAQGEGLDTAGRPIEQQLPIYRSDGAFQAVYLEQPGQWTVRFVYSPRSFLLGLYTTFLAGVVLLLLSGWWAWRRFYRGAESEMGTVAKNSAVQMVMSLLGKGIDFAFAMLRLRVLSPAGEGSFAFAIAFYGIFEILTRFGLGTLLTRDVAQERERAGRYLANVVVLRLGLWLLSLPLMTLVGLAYRVWGGLTTQEAQAIALFAVALLFANLADAVSAVFNAFEKMEYPAALATVIAVAKVALGALVLLPPFEFGFVGLAGVSLVMNAVQVVWLYVVLRRTILPHHPVTAPTRLGLDKNLQRQMLRDSGPLMLNHLLASIFWRIDLWILKGFAGAAAVGIFSAGVKYLDGLNVIPSYFTLAIFPLMSRYARNGTESLVRAYRLAVQLLFLTALPIAVCFTFAATPLIQILGGAAYLPDSAIALSILIWSIPIGFVNSVTQYVLIAVGQQRFLTKAFVIGVLFTTLANLIFVPRYGYLAAAIILIPAELSLFIPFYWAVRRHVAAMPWLNLCGRPLLAAGVNAGVVWGLNHAGTPLLLSLGIGFLAYVGVLIALGTFRGEEFAALGSLVKRQA